LYAEGWGRDDNREDEKNYLRFCHPELARDLNAEDGVTAVNTDCGDAIEILRFAQDDIQRKCFDTAPSIGYNKMLQYVYFSFTIYNKELFLWKQ
jgi:hypothetical protein